MARDLHANMAAEIVKPTISPFLLLDEIDLANGKKLGLFCDQVAGRAGIVAVIDHRADFIVVSAEAPLSFKVGEIARLAGDVSRLGMRDLPDPQLELVG